MKILLVLLFTSTLVVKSFPQPANSPYPIIFVHGLNSDDQTWSTTLNQLGNSWTINSGHILNAVLNSRGGDTTLYTSDVLCPLTDVNGNIVNSIAASQIYAVNFGNFWNRNPSDPRILLYNNSTPGSNQSPSNQSAIYKQAYALKMLIDSVLRVTGSAKVILVGHSMGGLAIREYLQRIENGIHKWWIDPNDPVNGHKVAKVVTTGTPNLGTNTTSIPLLSIDNNSEAMRDMKYSYPSGQNASYIFGNPESFVPSNYYNADINCNGSITDTVTGLSSGNLDNSAQPLPVNILYTWITSNYIGFGSDLAVPTSRQWLRSGNTPAPVGVSDTLFNTKNHLQQTSDATSLIRGLDEPDKSAFAYSIDIGEIYSGFVTLQSGGATSDTDYYRISVTLPGKVTASVKSVNAGVSNFSLLSDGGTLLVSKNLLTAEDSISYKGSQGNYYLRILGNSSQNAGLNSYRYSMEFIPSMRLNLTLGIEGMWNGVSQVPDTMRIFLRSNVSPFGKIDSAVTFLNSSGNSQMSFVNADAGNYYIQTEHRNALETWSSAPEFFADGSVVNYDFTAAQSEAYGNNQIQKPGRWCLYSGDVDGSGEIDLTDIISIFNDAQNFETGYVRTDLTGDDLTDVSDLIIAFNNSNNFVTVISP